MNTEQNYVGGGSFANTPPQTAKNTAKLSLSADSRIGQFVVNPATGGLTELWLPLPLFGLERFYEVSNAGTVRNALTGSIVKTALSRDGEYFSFYHPVTFKYTCVQVHRAVAFAFVPNPNGWQWVKRKNGNKQHNYAANLEWVPAPSQQVKVAKGTLPMPETVEPFSAFILNRLQAEGRLTELERQLAGIVSVADDSMTPRFQVGARFVAVPVNLKDYASLVGKVVAVVVKANRFAFYLGRVVSITEGEVHVSRDNSEWSDRIESRSVIASIARVVSVLDVLVS